MRWYELRSTAENSLNYLALPMRLEWERKIKGILSLLSTPATPVADANHPIRLLKNPEIWTLGAYNYRRDEQSPDFVIYMAPVRSSIRRVRFLDLGHFLRGELTNHVRRVSCADDKKISLEYNGSSFNIHRSRDSCVFDASSSRFLIQQPSLVRNS